MPPASTAGPGTGAPDAWLLARDEAWTPVEQALLQEWSATWAHALAALQRRHDLLARQHAAVAAGCGGVTDFLTHHQAGKVRIVAVSSPPFGTMA